MKDPWGAYWGYISDPWNHVPGARDLKTLAQETVASFGNLIDADFESIAHRTGQRTGQAAEVLAAMAASAAAGEIAERMNGTWDPSWGPEYREGFGPDYKPGKFDNLPPNAQSAYNGYDAHGWQGNYSGQVQGTRAGKVWKNKFNQLPSFDSFGDPIIYYEFDINGPIQGIGRDAQRFIWGNDGSVYYTADHYTTFTKIK